MKDMDKKELKEVLLEVEKEKNMMVNQEPEESSIDYKELMSKACQGRKFIISVTVIFMILGLINAFTMTRNYTTTVTLVPELGKSGGSSSLSSISSMLGLGGALSFQLFFVNLQQS